VLNIVSGLCFAGFVVLASLLLVFEKKSPRWPSRRVLVNTFLAYAVSVSFAAALTQRDAWPFSTWPFAAAIARDTTAKLRIIAVDAQQREHDVDYRAWQPLEYDELSPWLQLVFPRLEEDAKTRVAQYLLDLAERSRLQGRLGQGVGYFDRFLGPFTAPYFLLHPKLWSGRAGAPADRFVGLRFYMEAWPLEVSGRDERKVTRTLVYAYPTP
jgi:hypothetical protein